MKLNKIITLSAVAVASMTMLVGCGNKTSTDIDNTGTPHEQVKKSLKEYKNAYKAPARKAFDDAKRAAKDLTDKITGDKQTPQGDNQANGSSAKASGAATDLMNKDYQSGQPTVIQLNGNKAQLNMADWKSDHIEFSNLDNLHRAGVATAYLDHSNYGKSEGRAPQTWKPAGWNNQPKRVKGKRIRPYDRGHIIAYTVTFNLDEHGKPTQGHDGSLDNPLNLMTQTTYSNRVLFPRYEEQVRNAIKGNHKVIYRVQPMYRNNELVPRGYWMQGISDNGQMNFNVFIYNVIEGLQVNYSNGSTVLDSNMHVK